MILQIVTYLKEFSTVTVVTEDLMLRTFSSTTFILMFLSILVTGITITAIYKARLHRLRSEIVTMRLIAYRKLTSDFDS